ncbi:MAG: hypothetical protein AAFQ80_22600 [Cyanobacteria bacterium J06621_8]
MVDSQSEILSYFINRINEAKEQRLGLRNNELKNIPESITKLTNLIVLNLDDNPLEQAPLEIAKEGIKSIRSYFQQLAARLDSIYEAKLIIVAEGGAGKTTLTKKIENSNYELRQDKATKEGIEVIIWKFLMTEKEREFQVNI